MNYIKKISGKKELKSFLENNRGFKGSAIKFNFRDIDFSKPKDMFGGHKIIRSNFENCSLNGIKFKDCKLSDITFRNINGRSIDFSGIEIKSCMFIDCKLPNSDFSNSTLSKCSFCNCTIMGADFSGVDFCDTTIIEESKYADRACNQRHGFTNFNGSLKINFLGIRNYGHMYDVFKYLLHRISNSFKKAEKQIHCDIINKSKSFVDAYMKNKEMIVFAEKLKERGYGEFLNHINNSIVKYDEDFQTYMKDVFEIS